MKDFDDLKRLFSEGRIDRRVFIKRAMSIGMAAAIPASVITKEAYAAGPKRGGVFRTAVRGGPLLTPLPVQHYWIRITSWRPGVVAII